MNRLMTNKALVAFASSILTTPLLAETSAQIGAGWHASDITNNTSVYDAKFSSPVFSARLLPSKHFAIETNYYLSGGGSFDLNDTSGSSSFETSGLELNLLFGSNMMEPGFFAYAGVGYFSENWDSNVSGSHFSASGLQAPVGLGYNFGNFSVDLQYAYREASAYDGSVFDSGSDVEASIYQLRLLTNL
ncbi:hypothetical protein [Marinomonas sp. THO17]|uniref:hypothetical protein n=1 Tax=Marinomonas sp. THO17 TaxID=3149048 RepID=UPI00336C0A60